MIRWCVRYARVLYRHADGGSPCWRNWVFQLHRWITRHFAQCQDLAGKQGADIFHDASAADVERALAQLYGGQPVSL